MLSFKYLGKLKGQSIRPGGGGHLGHLYYVYPSHTYDRYINTDVFPSKRLEKVSAFSLCVSYCLYCQHSPLLLVPKPLILRHDTQLLLLPRCQCGLATIFQSNTIRSLYFFLAFGFPLCYFSFIPRLVACHSFHGN